MDIQKLKYFCVVARHLNFSKAAEECHMAQPAMSRSISSLEEELGFQLFARTRRHVELTSAGDYFLQEATKIVEAYEIALQSGRTISKTSNTLLNIGFGGFDRNFAKFYVERFMKKNPLCTILLQAYNYDNIFEGLLSGSSDIIFAPKIRVVDKQSVQYTEISKSNYVIAVGTSHPLSKYDEVTPAMLEGMTFICSTDINMSWDQKYHLTTIFNHYGINPGCVLRTNSADSLLAMLELGMGITFLSQDIVLDNSSLKLLRIRHADPTDKTHVAAYLLPAKRSIVSEFFNFVENTPFHIPPASPLTDI